MEKKEGQATLKHNPVPAPIKYSIRDGAILTQKDLEDELRRRLEK